MFVSILNERVCRFGYGCGLFDYFCCLLCSMFGGCLCWLIACCRLVLGCLFALFEIGGVCVCFAACCFAGFACVRCFAMG